ncbi:hypothetical protein [Hydrogenophaga sp.]
MNSIRRYAKTTRAWDALARPDLLGREAHTLLLMANGRRSEEELGRLLGEDVSGLLEWLHQQGYLQCTQPAHTVETDDDIVAGA